MFSIGRYALGHIRFHKNGSPRKEAPENAIPCLASDDYLMVYPPSMSRSCPVIMDAPLLHR